MILIERREMIESFVKEIVNVIDFTLYEPLDTFIEGTSHLRQLLSCLKIVFRALRSYIAKKKMNFVRFICFISSIRSNYSSFIAFIQVL
jgi:uncharacterized protein YfbU (UPF0304 family)